MTRSRIRTLLGGAAIVVLACVVPAGIAAADTAPVPTLTSASVNAGGAENVSGGGCAARASVQIKLDSAVLVTVRSGTTGQYSAHLIIPASAVTGTHRITMVCAGPSGSQVTETAAVDVQLPFSGSDTVPLGAAGFSLLLVGGALATRRRRVFT